ncbi:hypothetical protein [Caenispirillum salinarum]|uniref:hypothetical protein n=1 Tax=Caenispirillum salinarum TaxID=859058 RepID=UPI00384AEE01
MAESDPTMRPGRAPGWRLTFHAADGAAVGEDLFAVDHTDHYADVSVSLEGGLTAGRLTVTLWRLRDDHFAALAHAQAGAGPAGDTTRVERPAGIFVSVRLFWRDRAGDAPGDDAAPVLETFRVTRLARSVEGLEIATHVEGRTALYDRIANARTPSPGDPVAGEDALDAAARLLEALGLTAEVDFTVPAPDDGSTVTPGPIAFPPGRPALEALSDLRRQMMARPPFRRGRALFLFRDGMLTVGPWRPIPHDAAAGTVNLDAREVIVDIASTGDHAPVAPHENVDGRPKARAGYRLTCLGQPDLKPGDLVSFTPLPSRDGLFGGFGLASVPAGLGNDAPEAATLYISGVAHDLGRRSGWRTVLSGVVVDGAGADAWDVARVRDGEGDAGEDAEAGPSAGAAEGVRKGVGDRINSAFAARPVATIAEVRRHVARTEMDGDRVRLAAHATAVLRGSVDHGGTRRARLDAIDRAQNDIQGNVPYLTSFAWGPYGQVLPRYPGTRVMLLNNQRNPHDPVDIGALWQTRDDADTTAPARSAPGDWWLILPAFKDPAAIPAKAEGTDPVPLPEEDRASHDLIDGLGERVVHVNGFTIRSFVADDLTPATDRPAGTGDSGILIEHASAGSAVRMLKDGTVEIVAAGDLTLKGANVKIVATEGTVDVSKGGS